MVLWEVPGSHNSTGAFLFAFSFVSSDAVFSREERLDRTRANYSSHSAASA